MANDVVVSGTRQFALPAELPSPELFFGRKKPVGLEGFSYRELGLEPQLLQLVHSVRGAPGEVGTPGQYRLGQNAYTDPLVVFLLGHKIRTFLEGPADRPRTVCASSDGLRPHDEVPEPRAASCLTCPYGNWHDKPNGEREPPACQEGIALLGLLAETSEPFWFLCRKTAFKPAKAFGREVGLRRCNRLSDLLVQMKKVFREGKGGPKGVTWYEPVFEIVASTNNGYDQLSDFVQEARYVPIAVAASSPAAVDPEQVQDWTVPV